MNQGYAKNYIKKVNLVFFILVIVSISFMFSGCASSPEDSQESRLAQQKLELESIGLKVDYIKK